MKNLDKLSYRSRRQKQLAIFNKKLETYLNMPEVEFTMEYVNTKAKYELRKSLFIVARLVIIIAIVMDSWNYLFNILSLSFNLDIRNGYTDVAQICITTLIISKRQIEHI